MTVVGEHMMETVCPACGKVNDCQAAIDPDDDSVPNDGDLTICIGCGSVAVFDGGRLRLPTAVEQAELDTAPEIRLAVIAWRRAVAH